MAAIRLDKLLSNRTPHSRSDIKGILKNGAVQVDGKTECDGSRKIDPDTQTVTLYGKKLVGQQYVYFLLNKPKGCISATEDRSHRTVIDLLPKEKRVRGLFPAGRLDADSTGMLLLTDDGDLAHRMLAPKSHVPKYYLVRLAEPCTAADVKRLAEGITLGDGTVCMPAEARVPKLPDRTGNYAVICLHEGKYHQVKRMLAALGNHVESLHRAAIGSLVLPPELPIGGHVEVLHKDVESMLKADDFDVVYERIMTNFSSYSINEWQ